MKSFLRPSLLAVLAFAVIPFTTTRAETFFAINVSSPLLVSGSAGVYLGNEIELANMPLRPVLEGEAGIGGGKLLIGFDSIGEGLGVGLKGSLLRTWFEPIGADKNTTYMGMELQGGISSIVLSLGGYRRIDGDGDGWLGTISLGIRL
tara:strand:- start:12089 stop:12532 length:444 start_codon:yes stop_codon:yes gene_type:complete